MNRNRSRTPAWTTSWVSRKGKRHQARLFIEWMEITDLLAAKAAENKNLQSRMASGAIRLKLTEEV